MPKEHVILVDGNDNQIGTEEKVRCHLPEGRLHRAFTALIFDASGRLLLTRRAKEKMLWPGDWDGTVASHPREGETYSASAERRMPEELGAQCQMDYLMKFEYHVPYKDIGSENEICGTLIGVTSDPSAFRPIPGEIDEIAWASADDLADMLDTPKIYCPWMLIALALLPESDRAVLEQYGTILNKWQDARIRSVLPSAIRSHLPDYQWRLVP